MIDQLLCLLKHKLTSDNQRTIRIYIKSYDTVKDADELQMKSYLV